MVELPKRKLRVNACFKLWPERPARKADQAGTLRAAVIRKDACKTRWKHWATVFISIPSFIASSILSSAGVTLKLSRQRCLKFHPRFPDACSTGVQYGTEELKQTVYKSHR